MRSCIFRARGIVLIRYVNGYSSLFYREGAASIAPAPLRTPLIFNSTSTGYFHSITFAHPVLHIIQLLVIVFSV